MPTNDQEHAVVRVSQMRALIQDCRERVLRLRPAWGAHLVDGTLRRLSEEVDAFEKLVRQDQREDAVNERLPAGVASQGRDHEKRA